MAIPYATPGSRHSLEGSQKHMVFPQGAPLRYMDLQMLSCVRWSGRQRHQLFLLDPQRAPPGSGNKAHAASDVVFTPFFLGLSAKHDTIPTPKITGQKNSFQEWFKSCNTLHEKRNDISFSLFWPGLVPQEEIT